LELKTSNESNKAIIMTTAIIKAMMRFLFLFDGIERINSTETYNFIALAQK